MMRRASAWSRRRRQSTSRRAGRWTTRPLGRVRDVADQSVIAPGPRRGGHQSGEPVASARPSGSTRRRTGRRRSRPGCGPSSPPAPRGARSSPAARSAAGTATPSSTASRLSPASRHWRAARGCAGRTRRRLGHDVPPRARDGVPVPRLQSAVSAWRSVERRCPSCSHSSRSAGRRVPGSSRPSRSRCRGVESLLERRGASWTGAKGCPDDHSRSNPRIRSQSVTAALKASSSTRALLR